MCYVIPDRFSNRYSLLTGFPGIIDSFFLTFEGSAFISFIHFLLFQFFVSFADIIGLWGMVEIPRDV